MKQRLPEELRRLSVDEYKSAEKFPVVILLDNVRSLHNVGSAFRTADAFRVEKIILTGITGAPPHREIHKTALGATETVAWQYVKEAAEAIAQLQEAGYRVIAVEQTNKSVALQHFQTPLDEKKCLVFGNEVAGVHPDVLALADAAIEIPQAGAKHSLNVSVCVGIVLWQLMGALPPR